MPHPYTPRDRKSSGEKRIVEPKRTHSPCPTPPEARAPLLVIAGSKVFRVRTASYLLNAERQSDGWRVMLRGGRTEGATPLVEWSGLRRERALHPFSRMYLVSADDRAFEVRFDADAAGRCHISGDARTNRLRVMLCGDTPCADTPSDAENLSLVASLREGASVESAASILWPGHRVSVHIVQGRHELTAEKLALIPGPPARAMTGDAPLNRGYVLGEMELSVDALP